MARKTRQPTGSAQERIMNVASELFYKQGYRATGINQVIEKSGVAKATFYNHFPTKDDLCLAYLRGVVDKELTTLDAALADTQGARERFYLPIEWLRSWLEETSFRGCAFLHTVAEIPDHKSPLRRQGKILYDGVRERVRVLAGELIASDQKKYGHLDARRLTEQYLVAFAGTIALAELYHEAWPVEHALATVSQLIGD
jgi:AcrR family transcriptional regulator